ncbi:hypothetical protein BJX99DRAFT_172713 [Aspergillus californicus]
MEPPQGTNHKDQNGQISRPGTPPRPPYSPVTPVFASLTPTNGSAHPIIPPAASPSPTSQVPPYRSILSSLPPPVPPTFAPEPPPVPISESENPDAIALRSAISILQLQKQQSVRDIQCLERMKEAAALDPEKFAGDLAAGKLSRKDKGGFIDFNHEDEEEDDSTEPRDVSAAGLGTLPEPQNIVRMPPINWAKYQIAGESLDKMHEEEQRRPSISEPRRDEYAQRAPEYMLASPYQPLVDKLESPSKAKGINKSKKG